jgi:PAS domain S-box-containing protein
MAELEDLRTRLAEAEETLRAIRGGEVDALLIAGDQGEKVHLLGGGDRIYRQFIETINEGTATLSAHGDILSCNASLAKTLRRPLGQVLGTAMRDHLSPEDHETLSAILTEAGTESRRRKVRLRTSEDFLVPVYLSATLLNSSAAEAVFCLVLTDLEEVISAEASLRQSQERLRFFVDNAPSAIAMFDREMRYMAVSHRWLSDYRLVAQDVIGRSHYDVIPDLPERWRDIFARCLGGAVEKKEEDAFPRADGTVDWLRWEIHPWRNKQNEIGGIFVFSEVINEHKRLKENLEQQRTLLLTLINSLPDFVYVKDRESRFILANRAMAEFMGAGDPSGLIGKTDHDFYAAEDADRFLEDERQIIDEGRVMINRDESRGSPSGESQWILTTKVPFRDEAGAVAGLVGTSRDITDRKLAEQKQEEQAALLDIATDAILVCDLRNRILYWNKSATRIFGWSREEAQGRDENELLYSPARADEPVKTSAIVMEKGEWSGELHPKTREGRELTVEASLTLVRDSQGTPTGVLAVNTDVTEQRVIQSQFLRVQRLESLGTLAGGIAHDLNNILTPILMGVEALSLRHSDDQTKKILDLVRTAGQRGADIVRQVLSFARGMEGERAELQLKHILREIEQIIHETFPKSIDIKSKASKDLLPVMGDATQMHQVLMNLCVNARDAMPDGGKLTLLAENVQLDEAYARMHIEAKPGRYVVLKVEDTGMGMAPGILDKIFDPFFTTKEPGKGTGLGLSTTRSIVKSHAGFMTVYSEVGKGSSFGVYIPSIEQGPGPRVETIQEGIPMGEGELILVVDDEAAVREIAKLILESYGYRMLTAADGTEALALYIEKKTEIQVVVTDMMMPYMDGAATIRALRKIDPGVKIIATSGLAAHGKEKEAGRLGVDAFLFKPYTAETLLYTLRDVLRAIKISPLK